MIRTLVVLALLLSSAAMMRGVAHDWRQGPPPVKEGSAAKKAGATAVESTALPQVKPLQPPVPANLPDLKDGYLFNPERMLAGATPPAKTDEPEKPIDTSLQPGLAAKINDVTYAGSLITKKIRRALIVYTEAEKGKAAAPAQPASKSSKAKPPGGAAPGGEKHAQLELGDLLDGYTVAEIQPDKIIFSKGEETVEKMLHDPSKKRQAPPPMKANPGPPGGGAQPHPAGVQSTTIGGAAPTAPVPGSQPTAPTPGGANPPNSPTAPNVPNPGSPTTPAAPTMPSVKTPPTPGAASGSSSSSTQPVRKMVISRQPSTTGLPDTSRVIRQTDNSDGPTQAPPTAVAPTTNEPVAMPPSPGSN